MKKLTAILLALLAMSCSCVFGACSKKDNDYSDLEESSKIEYSEIEFPTYGLCVLIPAPKSKTGYIELDSSKHFYAYINNTSAKDFNDYINACSEAGFNVDYEKRENYYYSKNDDGVTLILNYGEPESDVMCIQLDETDYDSLSETSEPEKESEKPTVKPTEKPTEKATQKATEKPTQKATEKPKDTSKSESKKNNSEFRDMLDSYEKFIDKYIDIMEKYKKDPTSVMDEYMDYLSKYTDWAKKISKIKSSDYSTEDWKYYIEVTTRVVDKLSKVKT